METGTVIHIWCFSNRLITLIYKNQAVNTAIDLVESGRIQDIVDIEFSIQGLCLSGALCFLLGEMLQKLLTASCLKFWLLNIA